jgi:hypothetical protein
MEANCPLTAFVVEASEPETPAPGALGAGLLAKVLVGHTEGREPDEVVQPLKIVVPVSVEATIATRKAFRNGLNGKSVFGLDFI